MHHNVSKTYRRTFHPVDLKEGSDVRLVVGGLPTSLHVLAAAGWGLRVVCNAWGPSIRLTFLRDRSTISYRIVSRDVHWRLLSARPTEELGMVRELLALANDPVLTNTTKPLLCWSDAELLAALKRSAELREHWVRGKPKPKGRITYEQIRTAYAAV